jgi:hypothetical protein
MGEIFGLIPAIGIIAGMVIFYHANPGFHRCGSCGRNLPLKADRYWRSHKRSGKTVQLCTRCYKKYAR